MTSGPPNAAERSPVARDAVERRRRRARDRGGTARAPSHPTRGRRAPRSRRSSGPSGASARTPRACAARRGSTGRRRRTARGCRAGRSRRDRRDSSPDRDRGRTRPTGRPTRRGSPSVSPTWRTKRERTLARPIGKSSSPVSWKRTSAFRPSGRIGKNGGHMSCANTSPSGPSGWRGPWMSSVEPGLCSGAKNGRPCTWSQCRCVSSTVPWNSRRPSRSPYAAQSGAEIEHDRRLAVAFDATRTTSGRRTARTANPHTASIPERRGIPRVTPLAWPLRIPVGASPSTPLFLQS